LGRRINNTYLEKNWRRKPAMAVLGTRKEAGPGTGAFLITNLTWETIRDPLLLALRGSPRWLVGESTEGREERDGG
jgi:hypothetical protein